VHIIGHTASELIHTGQAFLDAGADAAHIVETLYNYPTFSDMYRHAALVALLAQERREPGERTEGEPARRAFAAGHRARDDANVMKCDPPSLLWVSRPGAVGGRSRGRSAAAAGPPARSFADDVAFLKTHTRSRALRRARGGPDASPDWQGA
jgi:hypothetical protein